MVKSRFLAMFVIVAALICCAPFDLKRSPLLVAALTSGRRVSITGNSVLSHTSRCDQDSRSLVSMLGDDLHETILDLSFSGESLSESANLAAASLKNAHVQTVIVPVSVFQFVDWDTDPIRTYALFRLINPDLYAPNLLDRVQSSNRFGGNDSPIHGAFDYNGTHYPDYEGIKRQYMTYEREVMRCPENDGADLRFVAANYHQELFAFPILDKAMALVASLGKEAVRRRKSLLLVILPIDFDLITKLGVTGPDALREKVHQAVQTLISDGLNVVDLSGSLHNEDFADHWCACGHLVETGRLQAAVEIARHVQNSTQDAAFYPK